MLDYIENEVSVKPPSNVAAPECTGAPAPDQRIAGSFSVLAGPFRYTGPCNVDFSLLTRTKSIRKKMPGFR